ncbi:MAG: agmatinase family protein [Pseudomonadota bacterium]|nr:agmatinase family protein [Pseudomonadota bacterium]
MDTSQFERAENGEQLSPAQGIFGFDVSYADADYVVLGVPWELTVSGRKGTAHAPAAIVRASHDIDLCVLGGSKHYRNGIHFQALTLPPAARHDINRSSQVFNTQIRLRTAQILAAGKKLALVGGEHSCPYGYLQALAAIHAEFGILHFDAHLDYRRAYQGYDFSHASIMYQVMETIPAVCKNVHVAIRDFCQWEHDYAKSLGERDQIFFAWDIHRRQVSHAEIVACLPAKVYISFDVDAFEVALCPSTGTPVPGGISYYDAVFILQALKDSGREVIGFDLCEVVPTASTGHGIDENVGARILYQMLALL